MSTIKGDFGAPQEPQQQIDITKTRRPIIYPSGKIIAHDNRYMKPNGKTSIHSISKRHTFKPQT